MVQLPILGLCYPLTNNRNKLHHYYVSTIHMKKTPHQLYIKSYFKITIHFRFQFNLHLSFPTKGHGVPLFPLIIIIIKFNINIPTDCHSKKQYFILSSNYIDLGTG